MASNKDQKPASRGSKPATASGEVKDRDLDKVSGGVSKAGGATVKRPGVVYSNDPCDGGE